MQKSKWFDRDIFKEGMNTEGLDSLTSMNPIKLEKQRTNKKKDTDDSFETGNQKKVDSDGFEDIDDEEEKEVKKVKKEKLKILPSMKMNEKRRRKVRQDSLASIYGEHHMELEDDGKIEVVPQLNYDDYDLDSLA